MEKTLSVITNNDNLPLEAIIVLPQVRKHFDAEAHAQLVESIKDHGVMMPLIVRHAETDGTYTLIAGERRLRAAKEAGLTMIPVRVMATNVPVTVQLVENLQREELRLEEAAAAINSLYEQEKSQATVARMIGKSVPWVSKMLTVHNKLGKYAAELLATGATEDGELLGLMTRIEELENSWPRVELLTEEIKSKRAGRAEARELYDELKEELADSEDSQGQGEETPPEEVGYNFQSMDQIHLTLKEGITAALDSWKTDTPQGAGYIEKLIKDTVRAYQGHALAMVKPKAAAEKP